jgi:hypothetical protein
VHPETRSCGGAAGAEAGSGVLGGRSRSHVGARVLRTRAAHRLLPKSVIRGPAAGGRAVLCSRYSKARHVRRRSDPGSRRGQAGRWARRVSASHRRGGRLGGVREMAAEPTDSDVPAGPPARAFAEDFT